MTNRIACAQIDLAALRHNLECVHRYAPGRKVMCVIKSNAYGHGLLTIADALHAADGFAVACVSEAMALREHGIDKPITVFQGFSTEQELNYCTEQALWPVVHEQEQIKLLQMSRLPRPSQLWLKLSTGMNRLGFAAQRATELWQLLRALPGIEQVGLMTHMARADEGPSANETYTQIQLDRFKQASDGIDAPCSVANSACLLGWPDLSYDWIRPGIMLYGASPFLPSVEHPCVDELRAVMTLSSRLIAINHLRKGDRVGYGEGWQCQEDMSVGVVAIGYGDGYPRHIDAQARVLIGQQRVPVIGRVSMDLLTVDLSQAAATVGEEVDLWGKGLPVADIAQSADTIAYELTCGVYGRVNYQYCD